MFPLYWAKSSPTKRHRVVFPFYWHFENDELHTNVTLLGPLIKSTTGKAKTWGVLPFAWFTRDGDTGDKSNVFLPVFYQSSGRDQFTLLTALAGYRRKGPSTFWYALPFVLRNRDEITDTTTTVIPPLMLYSFSSPEEGFTSALLLYWHRRDIASSTTMALPLFYDVHDYRISRTTVLLPFFVRHERMADQNTYWFAPLFYRHIDADRRDHRLLPAGLGLQARRRPDHDRGAVLRALEARRPHRHVRLPDLLRPRGATRRRQPRRDLSALRDPLLGLGREASRRLHVGDPGRPGRPRAHRPPPLPAHPLHDLRDGARPPGPDLLVQQADPHVAQDRRPRPRRHGVLSSRRPLERASDLESGLSPVPSPRPRGEG